MVATTWEQWMGWVNEGRYSMLPYVGQYSLDDGDNPPSWELLWEVSNGYAFVLESGMGGRYTFFGCRPKSVIYGRGREASVLHAEHKGGWTEEQRSGEPLRLVEDWMRPYRAPVVGGVPAFTGGCAGYWSYDIARSIERLPEQAEDALHCPDYYFMRFEQIWAIDHQEKQLYCIVHVPCQPDLPQAQNQPPKPEPAPSRYQRGYDQQTIRGKFQAAARMTEEMKLFWDELMSGPPDGRARRRKADYVQWQAGDLQIDVEAIDGVETAFSKKDYIAAVEKIQQYIAAGDVFQVNLSVRQSRKLADSPATVYEWLRLLNPSPYMGLLHFPDLQLVSASPERLVQLADGRVAARPIAGTRPRGESRQEDVKLAQELCDNEKERAEHIMLVDLQRNDLGKVCRYGTVKATALMHVEYYSHVMHLVSDIDGRLAEGKHAFDVIEAVFPGGTITGAPKIRTMEIIEELEPVRRGPYTGSIGWIDYNGNMEFNITIRTLIAMNGKAHVQAGAGIVIDSDPAKEYQESLNKMKALWKAIQYSELAWQQKREGYR